ncbi:hypothetical protein B0H10DRAFT_1833114 [Mycena sp. CBHHK59/15]|nr:hypothetical protein B0H10DRAFT_1833114 [Mycena sp. CBHHK59/15]
MSHYSNPMHAQAARSSSQAYVSLSQGSVPQRPAFTSPTRRRVPQAPYSPTSKWKVATGRAHQLHASVAFDYPGQVRQGVSMRELSLKATSTLIQGAGDAVFSNTGLQRIVFRILWPGYEHVEWCRAIVIVSPNGAPITRVALGQQVAQNFARFIEKTQYETSSVQDWMVGPSCVRFEHLYLISLHNVFEDSWQADIALDL